MGTRVSLVPIYGAFSDDPPCYLLSVDEYRFLLDVGWTDSFDPSVVEPLRLVAPNIDAVLLSHPDLCHLGALPYARGKLGLSAIVYCTEPVRKLGTLAMYDSYISKSATSNFDLFDLDDVDAAFENTIPLKYSEPQALGENGTGITITPYAAGHLLGGTIWKITKDAEEIVYAVDYNHRMERHLDGAVLQCFIRPSILITDTCNALAMEPKKKQRDSDLFEFMLATLRAGGDVLMPCDAAGRVIEMLIFIDKYFSQAKLPYPVVFLSPMCHNTLKLCKSFLEWMGQSLRKTFEANRDNPFNLE